MAVSGRCDRLMEKSGRASNKRTRRRVKALGSRPVPSILVLANPRIASAAPPFCELASLRPYEEGLNHVQ